MSTDNLTVDEMVKEVQRRIKRSEQILDRVDFKEGRAERLNDNLLDKINP